MARPISEERKKELEKIKEEKLLIRKISSSCDPIMGLRGRYSFKSEKSKRVWGHFEEKFIPSKNGTVSLNIPLGTEGFKKYEEYKKEIPTGKLNKRGNPEISIVFEIPIDILEMERVSTILKKYEKRKQHVAGTKKEK